MAPAVVPNQTRKRGRPTNASVAAKAASKDAGTTQAEEPQDAEDEGRPQKRNKNDTTTRPTAAPRKRNPTTSTATVSETAKVPKPSTSAEGQPPRKKRGRPSLNKEAEKFDAGGSNSKDTTANIRQQPLAEPSNNTRMSRRAATSNASSAAPSVASRPLKEPTTTTNRRKTSLRTSGGAEDVRAQAETIAERTNKQKRNQPSTLAPQAISSQVSTTNTAAKKPTGRRSNQPNTNSTSQSTSRSKPGEKHRKSGPSTTRQPTSTRPAPEVTEPAVPIVKKKPYRHIQSSVRHIPHATIESDWTPLAPSSVSCISGLLNLAERPVLDRVSTSQNRRQHAATAIRAVTRRMTNKLSRGLPFPPVGTDLSSIAGLNRPRRRRTRSSLSGDNLADPDTTDDQGRGAELNFEQTISTVAVMEKTLTPLVHSIDVLEAERRRLERELEHDYADLKTLETNARSEMRELREKMRRTHFLVRDTTKLLPTAVSARVSQRIDGDGGLGSLLANETPGILYKDLQDDKELAGLAEQLAGHVESIKSNLGQVEGVGPQIRKSSALLKVVLQDHLDEKRYSRVVYG